MCVNKKIEIVIGIESSLVSSWTIMCLNDDNIPSFFLAFDFCRFYVVIQVLHPLHNGQ